MSFDHDAAMERGAQRQRILESATHAAFDFVERQQLVGDNEAFVRLAAAMLVALIERQTKRPGDDGLNNVIMRKAEQLLEVLAKQAKSEFESDLMAVKLAQQMLASGTSKMFSDFGMWESRTFQEGAKP